MTSSEAVEKMSLGKDVSQEKFCLDPEDFAGSGISQDWEVVGE